MKGRHAIMDVDSFPTGIITIDRAFGCGGVPLGRIIEMYGTESSGKTTTTLRFIAACQKHFFTKKNRNGVAAFIDVEHALDPEWAHRNGVDMETLLTSQPDSGEDALNIVETMIKSGEVDLIIVDSVAALIPKAELEGEIGDHHVGAQARMMSQGLRKIKGVASQKQATVVFINQVREKVGVIFGCLHGDTLINFVDGRSIPIKDVVKHKMQGEVWSYSEDIGQFIGKNIIDWHNNGEVKDPSDFLSISAVGPGTKNGCIQITITPNHKVLISKEDNTQWVDADTLEIGDCLISKQDAYVYNGAVLNGSLGQFLSGVLSGDSNISRSHGGLTASLRIQDNIDYEYAKWKANKLNPFLKFSEYQIKPDSFSTISSKPRSWFNSQQVSELLTVSNEYQGRDPILLLSNFSWLGFAIWIMDDATYERERYILSIKRFKGKFDKLEEISKQLDQLGLYHHMGGGGQITFDRDISDHIAKNICSFVPPYMDRKLPSYLKNKFVEFELTRSINYSIALAKITSIRSASNHQFKQKNKYDITVEDNHCYMAGGCGNGIIVHNSPEVTPGGRALKYYSTIRAQISRKNIIKDGEESIGITSIIKMVKNKAAAPFVIGEYNICFGMPARPVFGIDAVASLLSVAEEENIVTKKGSFYRFESTAMGNGVNNTLRFLQENAEIYKKIEQQTYDRVFHFVQESKESARSVDNVLDELESDDFAESEE